MVAVVPNARQPLLKVVSDFVRCSHYVRMPNANVLNQPLLKVVKKVSGVIGGQTTKGSVSPPRSVHLVYHSYPDYLIYIFDVYHRLCYIPLI
jgi:hypothetical protein